MRLVKRIAASVAVGVPVVGIAPALGAASSMAAYPLSAFGGASLGCGLAIAGLAATWYTGVGDVGFGIAAAVLCL